MHNYRVGFWWNTDLRCEWVGEAPSELHAIAIALNAHRLNHWCLGDKAFKITVQIA